MMFHPTSGIVARAAFLGAALVWLWRDTAWGQRIADRPCEQCRLDLVQIATIPSFADGVSIVQRPMMAYANGTFMAAFTYDGELAVWRDGKLSTLGRSGGGPNEFPPNGTPRGFEALADGNVALINGNRLSIISSDGSRIVDQHVLSWVPTGMTVVGAEILVGAPTGDLAAIGSNGDVARSIKSPSIGGLPRLAASGDTAVWVGDVEEYRFALVNMSGSTLREFYRNPPWMKEASADLGSPKVVAMREMDDSLVLVVLSVPDPAFDPRMVERPGPIRQLRGLPIYDTIVEVIDPVRGQLLVLVTARYDDVLFLVGGSRYLFAARELENGEIYFDVFEPHLGRK